MAPSPKHVRTKTPQALPEWLNKQVGKTAEERNADSIASVLDDLAKQPDYDRAFIEDVALESDWINRVIHKLGREPIGFEVVDADTQAVIAKVDTSDDKFLDLTTTASGMFDILVW